MRTIACLLAALALAGCAVSSQTRGFTPVLASNFPDPFVLEHEGRFIAYSTNSAGINLPVATSTDLSHWQVATDPAAPSRSHDAMPVLASWVREGRTWAPEVMEIGGRWLLYYTARHATRDLQCLGVAVAGSPMGPFRDDRAEPLVCQYALGGTIDANPFRDADGTLYLYYKSDGNHVDKGTVIWGQRLAGDGMSVIGEPVPLLRDDAAWEWQLVEAPAMVRVPAGYRMFYSAAYYGWDPKERLSRYSTGYSTCAGPLGPCTDAPENPVLASVDDAQAGCLSGPGHPAVFEARGRSFIAFHAWAATPDCRLAKNERFLYVAPLSWNMGKPVIGPGLRR